MRMGVVMDSSLVKRSVSIEGHRIDFSIEALFWASLEEIARDQATTTSRLVATIEAGRGRASLSSAIRVYVIDHFLTQAESLDDIDNEFDPAAHRSEVRLGLDPTRPRWLN
jgi:predicted DNA-binding ribbon-helix-helix protein